ncbi:L-histidine N(alpha)-methyltransferase [Pusillimonas sp.]|uniref:L-histidine N(alpha)-methyltransferase n=1 Tax=Pusillimonas sp. TaxID=3040095 RepID=UPI0029B94BCF|nr:L-histidine N(alpha)-methyltransferase [Pusillimonas sp.]MDX3894792.1 L-histidine N(alpha)-methyltransferase [Pusillimonas sp.]
MSIHSPLVLQSDADDCASDQLNTAAIGCSPAEHAELTHGLLASPAEVPPKYLYDTLGSKLFETLCLLPEYYPTRTETAIVRAHLPDIANAVGRGAVLIDLGAGNCAKAERLFDALAPSHYVAVDISADFLRNALDGLQSRHPHIRMTALGQDFSRGLRLPEEVPADNRLFFYPGSSLGNFGPGDAHRFLSGLRQSGGEHASLLLGVDLVKEAEVLNAAYDDALGLTGAFNLNLLRNLNRLLDADFDVRDWTHVAFFNEQQSRVEMHLQARRPVHVRWAGASRRFAEGERIHTESSYKYTRPSLAALLEDAGWTPTGYWTDPAGWFAVVHAGSLPGALRKEDAA